MNAKCRSTFKKAKCVAPVMHCWEQTWRTSPTLSPTWTTMTTMTSHMWGRRHSKTMIMFSWPQSPARQNSFEPHQMFHNSWLRYSTRTPNPSHSTISKIFSQNCHSIVYQTRMSGTMPSNWSLTPRHQAARSILWLPMNSLRWTNSSTKTFTVDKYAL
jgi:hypothetical protein